MADIVGWRWDEPPGSVEMWDGTVVRVRRGDTVAGYVTPCGTLVAVRVIKARVHDGARVH